MGHSTDSSLNTSIQRLWAIPSGEIARWELLTMIDEYEWI